MNTDHHARKIIKSVPVNTCLAVLDVLTAEQREAIERLLDRADAQSIAVFPGLFSAQIIEFTVRDRDKNAILCGAIEPDGCVNT